MRLIGRWPVVGPDPTGTGPPIIRWSSVSVRMHVLHLGGMGSRRGYAGVRLRGLRKALRRPERRLQLLLLLLLELLLRLESRVG